MNKPFQRFREILESNNITQRAAARWLDRDERTIRRWIAGDLPLSNETMFLFEVVDELGFDRVQSILVKRKVPHHGR
jgi:hypothetical protein